MTGVISIVLMSLSFTQAPQFEAALTGSWTGTLEYRDYRSDKRVTLPTTLVVSQAAPGMLTFAYVYDDGPGKTVKSQDRITVDAGKSTYRVQNGDGTYDGTFTAAGLAEFGSGSSMVTLMGKGDENGGDRLIKETHAIEWSRMRHGGNRLRVDAVLFSEKHGRAPMSQWAVIFLTKQRCRSMIAPPSGGHHDRISFSRTRRRRHRA